MNIFWVWWNCGYLLGVITKLDTGPRSAVSNVSGNRCQSDCRSRGHEFDPNLVLYFRGDWLWNNFYRHSPSFRWIIQEGLLLVTRESMCTKYWLTACSSLPRKRSVVRWTDRPAMTIAVDLGRKAAKQTILDYSPAAIIRNAKIGNIILLHAFSEH